MNRFFKNVIWLQQGLVFSQLFAFFISSFFFYKVLGETVFGLFWALFSIQEAVALLLYWDPGSALIHRIAASDSSQRQQLFSASWNFLLASSMLQSLFIFLLGVPISEWILSDWWNDPNLNIAKNEFEIAIIFLMGIPLTGFPLQWLVSYMQGIEDMKKASLLLVLQNISRPLGALIGWILVEYFVNAPLFPTMIAGVVFIQFVFLVPGYLLLRRIFPGSLLELIYSLKQMLDKALCKQIFVISADKKLTDLYEHIARWFLALSLGPASLAHFKIIMSIFGGIQMFLNPLSRSLLPRLTQIKTQQNWRALRERVWRVIKWGFLLGFAIVIAVAFGSYFVLFPHPLLYNMSPETVDELSRSGFVLLLLFPFLGIGVSNSSLSIILDKVWFLFKVKWIITVPIVFFAWFLIQNYGLAGACFYVFFYRGIQRLLFGLFLHKELGYRCQQES